MSVARRNLVWPLLVLFIGIVLLLNAIEVLPTNSDDLLNRSWGILLVIFGLNMLLVDRIRFGNWLALGISTIILGVIVGFAYQAQGDELRNDYTETIEAIPLGDNIRGLTVSVDVMATTVQFRPASNGARTISAQFVGSSESRVTMIAQEDDASVVELSIVEEQANSIPNLSKMGRGALIVSLPNGITINEFVFSNESGGATFDFRPLDVPSFNITLTQGNVDLFMPEQGVVIGDLTVSDGDVRMIVDPDIPMRIGNVPSGSSVDQNTYLFLADGSIETRNREYLFNLRVNIPNGILILEAP